MKWRASSGIAIASPTTTMPPEPIAEPRAWRLS